MSGHELLFRLSEARRAEQPKGLLDDLRAHVLAIDLGLIDEGKRPSPCEPTPVVLSLASTVPAMISLSAPSMRHQTGRVGELCLLAVALLSATMARAQWNRAPATTSRSPFRRGCGPELLPRSELRRGARALATGTASSSRPLTRRHFKSLKRELKREGSHTL